MNIVPNFAETLTALTENLQEEDPIDRSTRRQLAASHLIQQVGYDLNICRICSLFFEPR
jgi:hypothetical protein